jgi:carboxylesterase type B
MSRVRSLIRNRAIQYRLGMFGFLGGSAISHDGSLNAGLLDQRLALEWVQRHIHSFGGDSTKVTIFGGSAGGSSVTYQLIAGGAYDDPPFSKAIAEYPWWQPLLNESTQNLQYETTLRLSNCKDLNCLRTSPVETLQLVNQWNQNVSYPGPGLGYGSFWWVQVLSFPALCSLIPGMVQLSMALSFEISQTKSSKPAIFTKCR